LSRKRTILLYGRTRAGKSTQIGELAEHVFKTTGKKTRLYSMDRGGIDPILPYVEIGVIEPVLQGDSSPWHFMNKASRGFIRDKDGKWVLDPEANKQIGFYAFESMTAAADALMTSLASMDANVGGGSNISFTVKDESGESMKISGNNMSHYNVVQNRITEEVWQSQKLDADYILWTASVSKDDDPNSTAKVLGPEVVGKKLTAEVPRWFQLCFRIDCLPASKVPPKPESHILYLGNSIDLAAGNAVSLGNTRTPKDSPDLPSSIEPASLVQALKMIDGSHDIALKAIKARMGAALSATVKN
jgi:hypothetical protein